MKKSILLQIITVFIALLLCACTSAKDNTSDLGSTDTLKNPTNESVEINKSAGNAENMVVAYLTDASDAISSVVSLSKNELLDLSLNFYFDKNADKEASVIFNGTTYSGTYYMTRRNNMDNQFIDVYMSYHLLFSITRDSKELYQITGTKLEENEPADKERKFSEKECVEIANNFAKQYINIDEYEIKTSSITSSGIEMITYRKPYNNLPTAELLKIDISYVTGENLGFEMRSIGQFDDEEIAKSKASVDLLLKDSKAVADKKAEEICKEICDKKGYTLKSVKEVEENRMLYRYENGEYALITNYSVDYGAPSELLEIVTVVESPQTDTKIAE